MDLLPGVMIGILITVPTALAILICSRGNAVDRRVIYQLAAENERLNARDKATARHIATIYEDHNAEIADLKAQHDAELVRMGAAYALEFARGVEWERKRPDREAKDARWIAKMEAEHAHFAAEWSKEKP